MWFVRTDTRHNVLNLASIVTGPPAHQKTSFSIRQEIPDSLSSTKARWFRLPERRRRFLTLLFSLLQFAYFHFLRFSTVTMSSEAPPNDIESSQKIDDVSPNNANTNNNPSVFYCPITKQLLKDPVVLSDGISYERSAVEEREDVQIYSNRALKCIMEDSARSTFQKFHEKARQFITAENRPLSTGFYCPITLSVMHCPVIDPQGYTYERVAIESWIRHNGDSPVTREELAIGDLIPNLAVADLLLAEANKADDDLVHPAIQKWKTEAPPTADNISALMEMTSIPTASTEEAAVAPPALFPTTPEEYQAQLAERARRKRVKMACRLMTLVILILLMAGALFAPYLAAALTVIMLIGIFLVTKDATSV